MENDATISELLARLNSLEERVKTTGASPSASSRIAIIGMGARLPGPGEGSVDDFWSLLTSEKCAITEVPANRWSVDRYFDVDPDAPGRMSTRWGGFISNIDQFDAGFFGISPDEAREMDPQHRTMMQTVYSAIEDSGTKISEIRGKNVGIFTGVMTGDYGNNARAIGYESLITPHEVTGNEASFLSGRIAHWLDVNGPNATVCTACSSTLVALHLACNALTLKECDVAIVGGVNIILSPYWHIASSKIHSQAADGLCKTFDAAADGYVRGEGCGAFVLRRLDDAEDRGDRVRAIICGSAINHTGKGSSLTAPSPRSQASVIRAALKRAGIAPNSVVYLETHGSGTPLGDAIEVEGINAAYGSNPRIAPLLLGAVKTNIGHLEAASGAAGLIKLVLCLENKVIPPNLHYRIPNSRIDFRPDVARPVLTAVSMPGGYGAISSFGLSGINAHAILESAPKQPVKQIRVAAQGLSVCISAPSRSGLIKQVESWRNWFNATTPNLAEIADVAAASQDRRTAFRNRVCLPASSLETLIEGLSRTDIIEYSTGHNDVRILFPGYGDQYDGMAASLYANCRTFRDAFENVLSEVEEKIRDDVKKFTLANRVQEAVPNILRQVRLAGLERTDSDINRPILAHVSVFAFQFALAEALRHFGVTPSAMLGYSLGEITAATLAGVFQPAEAIRFVARRAALIEEAPTGAMVGVSLGAEALRRRLIQDTYIAAELAPDTCVVAGCPEAVRALIETLTQQECHTIPIAATRAMHTPKMADTAKKLSEYAADMNLREPKIPYISNLTGNWISPREAVDPTYYGRQIESPVQLRKGLITIRAANASLLEVGPGIALASQLAMSPAKTNDYSVIQLGRHRSDNRSETAILADALRALWRNGVELDWQRVGERERSSLVSMPPYSFEHRAHWRKFDAAADANRSDRTALDLNQEILLSQFSWQRLAQLPLHPVSVERTFVLFGNEEIEIASCIRALGVTISSPLPTNLASAHQCLQSKPTDIVLVLPEMDEGQSFLWPLLVLQAIYEIHPQERPKRFHIFSTNGCLVDGTESINPAAAACQGLSLSAALEMPGLATSVVDLPGSVAQSAVIERWLRGDTEAGVYAWRGNFFWERCVIPAERIIHPTKSDAIEQGAYVLVGGVGAVGAGLARQMAVSGLNVILTSRNPESLRARELRKELLELGVECHVAEMNVLDQASVVSAFDHINAKYGPISAVVFLAAESSPGLIRTISAEHIGKSYLVKAVGAMNVLEAMKSRPQVPIMLFSSVTSMTGMIGEAEYAAANSVLNAIAEKHPKQVRSILWGLWKRDRWQSDLLQDADEERSAIESYRQKHGISDQEGFEVLLWALESPEPVMIASRNDLYKSRDELTELMLAGVSRKRREARAESQRERPPISSPYVAPRSETERRVASIWSDFLGIEQIGINDSFFELGGQSLSAISLIAAIKADFSINLPVAAFLGAATVSAIANLIEGNDSAREPVSRGTRRRATRGDRRHSLSATTLRSAI